MPIGGEPEIAPWRALLVSGRAAGLGNERVAISRARARLSGRSAEMAPSTW